MNRIESWSRDIDAPIDYQDLQARLDFLGDQLFLDYEPSLAAGPPFTDRLTRWLDCAAEEEDQRLMLELVGELYFIGSMEMELLYQEVLHGPISWWIVDECNLDIGSVTTLESELSEALEKTWFCPVTDSMQIARFHHINNISGKNLRPDWHTLTHLGEPQKILQYMQTQNLDRLVLLEDFVGSGKQASGTLRFVADHLNSIPILFVPLVICPTGVQEIRELIGKIGSDSNLTFHPVTVLPPECILTDTSSMGGNDRADLLRGLLKRVEKLVDASAKGDPGEALYGFNMTGALSVLYTNCPNNVPPIFHHSSERWNPLFPRSVRK